MLFCRSLGKLPKAGLLRIKNAPKADIQLLVSGCEVHHPLAHHVITAKQHSSQQAPAQAEIELLPFTHLSVVENWLLNCSCLNCRNLLAIDLRRRARPCCSIWSGARCWIASLSASLAMLWL